MKLSKLEQLIYMRQKVLKAVRQLRDEDFFIATARFQGTDMKLETDLHSPGVKSGVIAVLETRLAEIDKTLSDLGVEP